MAAMLGVTQLTVQNAYAELQADGWTIAIIGRGTFVCPSVQPISLVPSIGQYLTPDSAISDMLQIDQVVGVRSMALAVPDSALFPADEFWNHVITLRANATSLMSYGSIQGDTHLRNELVRMLAKRGMGAGCMKR
ncbi:MAG: hypothetical protein GY943_01895 [Chloroflexi bacterium]|nr:hypothetical protein [Chloroflexota bacterium]